MDKASIIGDAVIYVQSLQDQAKRLEDEISVLESSSTKEDQVFTVPTENLRLNRVKSAITTNVCGRY